jgi:hypothetical protein
MIKPTVILLILLATTFNGFSQTSDSLRLSKNAIYVELLGSAGYLYNVSYDRIIYNHNNHHISVGMGAQYYEGLISDNDDNRQTITTQVNYLRGSNRHFLELGIGYYLDFLDSDYNSIITRIGYRYQKKSGVFFKIGVTPLIPNHLYFFGKRLWVVPWGGIALGYAF